jgi:hypothetical protein
LEATIVLQEGAVSRVVEHVFPPVSKVVALLLDRPVCALSLQFFGGESDSAGQDIGDPEAPVTDLAGANLTNADLTGACISRANLAGANLTGANLAIRGNFNMIAFSDDTIFCHTTMPGGTVNNTGC